VDTGFGLISQTDSIGLKKDGDASPIEIARVRGFDGIEQVYAVGYVNGGGLRLAALSFDNVGDLEVDDGSPLANLDFEVGPFGQIEIASYDQRGVFVVTKDHAEVPIAKMSVWALDGEPEDDSLDVDLVVSETFMGDHGVPAMCRVPDDEAEGDFLMARIDELDLEHHLTAYRSAARPRCGLIGIETFAMVGIARLLRRGARRRAGQASAGSHGDEGRAIEG